MNKIQLFLVIGLTKEGRHWDDQFVENLKELFKTQELYLIDLPGAGAFETEKSPLSMEKIIEKTRNRYKEKFDPDATRILISVSLGGMAGASWIEQFPNDFEHFVIMNSSFSNLSPVMKRVQPKAIKNFVSIFLTKSKEKKDRKIVKMCSNNTDRHAETLQKWDVISQESFMSPQNIVRQVLAGARFRLPANKPNVNVFVIAAKHDSLAHYSCSVNLAQAWDCPLHIIEHPHVGHAVHIDAPMELAQIIYDHINESN